MPISWNEFVAYVVALGDIAKISPCVLSTLVENAIHSFLIIHMIPSCQMYVVIGNPLLFLSISCRTISSWLFNSVLVADAVSHAENEQSNGCQSSFDQFKFRDAIQVTCIFRYSSEHKVYRELDKSTILVLDG